jgi:magnesium transporter
MDRLTILVTRIIDENNEKNFNGLRIIEEEGDELNKYMTDLKASRVKIGDDIYKMKHALITYLNTLWASWDVINSLRYGDAEIISDNQKLLQRIGILGDDISRQIALSEHMSEVLASGLAVLQTIYNNQLQILNNRLAFVATWLAVLASAVMVPNTIATVFGMNETFMDWSLTAPILILSTVVSAYFMYWMLKKKSFIPKKID